MEKTFVMIKPDGVQRRLAGFILQRFEQKGLRLRGMKLIQMDLVKAENLYSIHKGRPFYDTLVQYITSSPVIVTVWEGFNAISVARKLLGATFGFEAEPGTIRGDYGCSRGMNLIHGSDSTDSADREIPLFFAESELMTHVPTDAEWVNESEER